MSFNYIQYVCMAYEEVKRFIEEEWSIDEARESLQEDYAEVLSDEDIESLLEYMK